MVDEVELQDFYTTNDYQVSTYLLLLYRYTGLVYFKKNEFFGNLPNSKHIYLFTVKVSIESFT